MIRDIILYPDGRLETPCDPVDEFDTGDLHQLVADMFESMYFHGGIGLAAPQIGVMKQVAVIDPSSGRDSSKKIILVNPIISEMRGTQRIEEGCLCFPGIIETVSRAMSVMVDTRDPRGDAVQLHGIELLSRVLQHEIDHLNGILFIRRMSSLKREIIRRKIRKMLQSGEWATHRRRSG